MVVDIGFQMSLPTAIAAVYVGGTGDGGGDAVTTAIAAVCCGDGGGGGDALATAIAAVGVGGTRVAEVTGQDVAGNCS